MYEHTDAWDEHDDPYPEESAARFRVYTQLGGRVWEGTSFFLALLHAHRLTQRHEYEARIRMYDRKGRRYAEDHVVYCGQYDGLTPTHWGW